MSEVVDNRERARSLQRRLNDHAVDLSVLAQEAAVVFQAAGLHSQVHWLELEQRGYSWVETRSLHETLAVAPGDRLVVQVKAYRVQAGELTDAPPAGEDITFHHFFVESIAELVAAQARVRSSGITDAIRLEFPTNAPRPHLPMAGTFRVDVFDRILLGLRAALHLQLGSVMQ